MRRFHSNLAALHALCIVAFTLAVFFYWFVLADRGRVFLYGHLDAAPFDAVTRSRYWMAGLVAAGYLLPPYVALALWARKSERVLLPAAGPTLAYLTVPLAVGILVTADALGEPPLPLYLCAALVAAALAGVYLVLWYAEKVAMWGWHALSLAANAAGLAPLLLLFRAVELPGKGLSVSVSLAWAVAIGSVLFGLLWLGGATWLRRRRGQSPYAPRDLLAAAFLGCYVALPAIHHLIATPPGYKYITTAENFFAGSLALQGTTWLLALAVIYGTCRLAAPRPGT